MAERAKSRARRAKGYSTIRYYIYIVSLDHLEAVLAYTASRRWLSTLPTRCEPRLWRVPDISLGAHYTHIIQSSAARCKGFVCICNIPVCRGHLRAIVRNLRVEKNNWIMCHNYAIMCAGPKAFRVFYLYHSYTLKGLRRIEYSCFGFHREDLCCQFCARRHIIWSSAHSHPLRCISVKWRKKAERISKQIFCDM